MKYNWPLNDSSFTWLDRLKICKFFLNPSNRWTQDKYVAEFERKMAVFTDYKYAIFCSSGSAANTILAMYYRDNLKDKKKNIVVLPSVTWQTACSPWVREGFKPYFIDINLNDYGMDMAKLQSFLEKNLDKVAVVFPTSLLGIDLNIGKFKEIRRKFPSVEFAIDNCENTFSNYYHHEFPKPAYTTTTSTYFGHQLQSVEGGFLFTNSQSEYEKFLLYRNHGLVRSLDNTTFKLEKSCDCCDDVKSNYLNPLVDEKFDFNLLGSNFRNSEIHAFIGLLDFKKKRSHISNRVKLIRLFNSRINSNFFKNNGYSPFCLPIILSEKADKSLLYKIKTYLFVNGIEYRPIVSGFLGYQTPYKKYMDKKDFPNSVYIHEKGLYVGLHSKVKEKQIIQLTNYLNSL